MQQLKGLEGTVIVADNILFNGCGDNKEKAEKEYDDNLVKLSEARGQQNFTLNLEKVGKKSQEIKFIGHTIIGRGITVDSEKVQAVIYT